MKYISTLYYLFSCVSQPPGTSGGVNSLLSTRSNATLPNTDIILGPVPRNANNPRGQTWERNNAANSTLYWTFVYDINIHDTNHKTKLFTLCETSLHNIYRLLLSVKTDDLYHYSKLVISVNENLINVYLNEHWR